MVRRGEFLERATVLPGEPALEGLFHRGRHAPAVVVAAADPSRGGSLESPIVAEMAWALARAGHPSLRFNYAGVGASEGTFDRAAAAGDFARAVEHLAACIDPAEADALAAVGVGLGGALAVEHARSHALDPVVWILPEPDTSPEGLDAFSGDLVVVAPQEAPEALRAGARALAEAAPSGRYAEVPRADPAFRRGLVEVGRIAKEAIAPPGLIRF